MSQNNMIFYSYIHLDKFYTAFENWLIIPAYLSWNPLCKSGLKQIFFHIWYTLTPNCQCTCFILEAVSFLFFLGVRLIFMSGTIFKWSFRNLHLLSIFASVGDKVSSGFCCFFNIFLYIVRIDSILVLHSSTEKYKFWNY